jgi:hypothetical protein
MNDSSYLMLIYFSNKNKDSKTKNKQKKYKQSCFYSIFGCGKKNFVSFVNNDDETFIIPRDSEYSTDKNE